MEPLIRDLSGIDRVRKEWIDTFEEYIPKWLESLVPHYEVAKEHGADVLALSNVMYIGEHPEELVVDDVHYYLGEYPALGKELSFNGNHGHYPANWKDGFDKVYVEPKSPYGAPSLDSLYVGQYLTRYLNRKAPNDVLRLRIQKRFRELVGDDKLLFDFGYTSYILLNPEKQWYINSYKLTEA